METVLGKLQKAGFCQEIATARQIHRAEPVTGADRVTSTSVLIMSLVAKVRSFSYGV